LLLILTVVFYWSILDIDDAFMFYHFLVKMNVVLGIFSPKPEQGKPKFLLTIGVYLRCIPFVAQIKSLENLFINLCFIDKK